MGDSFLIIVLNVVKELVNKFRIFTLITKSIKTKYNIFLLLLMDKQTKRRGMGGVRVCVLVPQ